MNLEYITVRMSANVETVASLAKGVGDEQARWRPAPDKWSILEVIGHLYDEEQFDFRTRIDFTLNHPGEEWPPFDPIGWLSAQNYNDGILEETLQMWIDERRRSLEWLHGLRKPEWDRSYTHRTLGTLRAGDLLAAWLAHDYLHIGQLARLHTGYTVHVSNPYNIKYAKP